MIPYIIMAGCILPAIFFIRNIRGSNVEIVPAIVTHIMPDSPVRYCHGRPVISRDTGRKTYRIHVRYMKDGVMQYAKSCACYRRVTVMPGERVRVRLYRKNPDRIYIMPCGK